MKKKILVLTIFCILTFNSSVYSADNSPVINFNGGFYKVDNGELNKSRTFGRPGAGIIGGEGIIGRGGEPVFGRYLNTRRNYDFEYDKKIIWIVRDMTTKVGNYSVLRYNRFVSHETLTTDYYSKLDVTDKRKGIYISDSSGYIIGYCLLEVIGILPTYETNIFNQIKALPTNNTYLNNELSIPNGVTVTFYEAEHTNFIERYGIAKKGDDEILFLDAFYPVTLEEHLKPEIINLSNHILDLEMNY